MKIAFWSIGKPHEPYVKMGVEDFTRRINNYFPAEWLIIAPPKNSGSLPANDLKKKEAEAVEALLKADDYLVVLDEKGAGKTSEDWSRFLQSRANEGTKRIVFLIGGAFGVDERLLQKAQTKWSLSALTFPHQLVRLILAEQMYRACTILRNEKYHHR